MQHTNVGNFYDSREKCNNLLQEMKWMLQSKKHDDPIHIITFLDRLYLISLKSFKFNNKVKEINHIINPLFEARHAHDVKWTYLLTLESKANYYCRLNKLFRE